MDVSQSMTQYVEMVGASVHDETPHGCTFLFGGVMCKTPPESYRVVDGKLFIKQHVVKAHLRRDWRGESIVEWKKAQPINESVLADIAKAKEHIEQMAKTLGLILQNNPDLPNSVRNLTYPIARALQVLEHGIGNAAAMQIADDRNRRALSTHRRMNLNPDNDRLDEINQQQPDTE